MFTKSPNFSNLSSRSLERVGKFAIILIASTILVFSSGCTSIPEYIHNGFKVGPNYQKPPAPVASEWIDSKAKGINTATKDLAGWWRVFNDPTLDVLIRQAYQQNLTLRSAGTRILAARAERNIAAGNLFPQTQQAFGDYSRNQLSRNVANPVSREFFGTTLGTRFFDDFGVGFNLSWELDFWGRYRRAVEAGNAELDASVEFYDDALVLLISEVATTYVEIRVFQKQLEYIAENILLQMQFVKEAEARLKGGAGRRIDQAQQRSNLRDTLALKEQVEIALRQANNALCVLLGIPVRDLLPELGPGEIPLSGGVAPEVAVGMPADLLRRRPDVRRLERLVAAQSARIGIATAELYPHISVIGALGYESANFGDLFSPGSLFGTIGPSVRWDILNYGRLLNGIRVQDALFQTVAVDYQNLVLTAGREVEDGIVLFLRSQRRTNQLKEGAKEAGIAVKEARLLMTQINFNFNQAFVTSNFLVTEQQKLAQAQGDIALGLIQIYKALGGGWEIRLPDSVPPGRRHHIRHGPPVPMTVERPMLLPPEAPVEETGPAPRPR
jgi:NodT family efflux transporter outer membrane factor (OMF) lipoprotein